MGEALITRRGGISSGGGLDLKVIGGTTQPSNPTENTIWVNTDTPITSYAFSTTEPENPVEGFVWFNIGTESYTPIDVDKENTIMLYPTGCSQYINGAWIGKEFKTYSNGEWETGFWTHAYNKGDICEGLTGGWETVGMGNNANFNKPVAPTITYNDTSMKIVQGDSSSYQCGLVRAINQIDLTPYSQISIVVDSVSTTHAGATANLRIHDSFGQVATTGVVANVTCKTVGTHSLDVSSINRPVYMAILAYWGITFNVSEIRLEV